MFKKAAALFGALLAATGIALALSTATVAAPAANSHHTAVLANNAGPEYVTGQ